ncbi:MAG TPA: TetR/AcrR family transcriptional regulator [Flexivirga sp.]|uniref:TetR/AcrR family transcriptional regulator n=1 Tax=Flexivirga sp. TaxID=1962927 RepID=UPI002CD585D6|nr:TetR/AcrR family transcriptional regulator [Flexivirga sp.]HWC22402.1 TetR/AcrR family transcriptional regulator [Flexivirga sp.]
MSARIVQAADALFYARGINAVGMDEVRTSAGVSLKRLYTAFPGKEALILAVLRFRHGIWESGLEAAVEAATTPRDRLLAIFDFLESWFAEPTFRGCGFINAFGELGPGYPSIADYVREHKRSFRKRTDQLVAAAGLPAALAPQLVLLAEGAQTTAAIFGTPAPAADARAAAESLIAAHAEP